MLVTSIFFRLLLENSSIHIHFYFVNLKSCNFWWISFYSEINDINETKFEMRQSIPIKISLTTYPIWHFEILRVWYSIYEYCILYPACVDILRHNYSFCDISRSYRIEKQNKFFSAILQLEIISGSGTRRGISPTLLQWSFLSKYSICGVFPISQEGEEKFCRI